MNNTADIKPVVGSAKRPFVQRYFMSIFLVIASFMLFILIYVASGLASIVLISWVFTLYTYGIVVGLLVRNSNKRRGYVFSKPTRYIVTALIAIVLISCFSFPLEDGGSSGDRNLISLLLNLPYYHYLFDDISEFGRSILYMSTIAQMILMPATGIMIAVDAKKYQTDETA